MERSLCARVWVIGLVTGLALGVGVGLPGDASAQERDRYDDRYGTETWSGDGGGSGDAGRFSIRGGLGFSIDPDTVILGFEGAYDVTDNVAAGVSLQLGVDDDVTLVSPVVFGRYQMDLGEFDPDLRRIEPFVQGGLGFTFWDIDSRRSRRDDDTEFLLNTGFGVEYRIDDHLSVGSLMLFNFVPAEVFEERFYWSWEVATLRYRF